MAVRDFELFFFNVSERSSILFVLNALEIAFIKNTFLRYERLPVSVHSFVHE